MRLLGQLLLVVLVIAAAQAVLAGLVLGIVLLLIWGLLFRTAETVGLIVVLVFLKALDVHPLLTICVTALLGVGLWIAGRNSAVDERQQLLPPPLEGDSDEQTGR